MNARLHAIWTQLAGFFLGLPPARRLTVAAAGVGSTALVLGLAWWVQRPAYRPLFADLTAEDAGAIVQALEFENVPFRLDAGGRAVLVPAERVHELRLALASRGLPERDGVGPERSDARRSTASDFVQRLDYQRALQAELARTIGRLGGVESARVNIALPEPSPFDGHEAVRRRP